MQELLEAGAHFGHKVRRQNPKMSQYVYGARDGVNIIDLGKTEEKLKEAAEYAYKLGENGAVLLVIGTKKQSRELIVNLAKESTTPYITERWVGGMLTNFDEIKKNIRRLVSLKEQKAKGELARYTKKEQLLIDRKLQKFENELGGMSELTKIPDALFIIDSASESTAVKEAIRMNIPIIAICDTNADPSIIDYPIPANDDGIKSIKIVVETVMNSYKEGKKKAGQVKAAQEEAAIKAEEEAALAAKTAEDVAVLEEEVEKKALADSERKV